MIQLSLDQINAGLEIGGALLRSYDCVKLCQSRRFAGGSLITALFFFFWGIFNTVFYPSLGQTYSWIAAIALTLVNGLWLLLALYYNHKHSKECQHVSTGV